MNLVAPSPYSLSIRFGMLLCHFIIFGFIYIGTNSYAEYLGIEQSIITNLDKKIPFISAMIVPYLSSMFFFLLAFFYVNTKKSFHRLNQNIVLATLIAGWMFYLFPLSFGHTSHIADYPWKIGFTLLQSVDKPYNQAPSLHVVYGLLLWAALKDVFSKISGWFIGVYITLMMLSTLFVYQHHLIDIITGIIVAFGILFFSKRYLISYLVLLYLTLSSTCLLLGLMCIDVSVFVFLIFGYLSINFSLITLAYAKGNTQILGKNDQGKLNVISTILLMPYVVIYWLIAKSQHQDNKDKNLNVLPWLSVGSRLCLLASAQPYTHVIDLSAEMPRLNDIKAPSVIENINYTSYPLLDLQPISLTQAIAFCQIIDELNAQALLEKQSISLYIHCTMGISRSYAVVASYFVWSGQSSPTEIKKTLLSYNKDVILRNYYLSDEMLINLASQSPHVLASSINKFNSLQLSKRGALHERR